MTHFLQSVFWQAFQESQGVSTVSLSGQAGHQWSALALHETGAAHTHRLYAPYGPSFADEADLGEALSEIEKTAKEAGDVFVRIEPVGVSVEAEKNAASILRARGYTKVEHIQPEDTLIADVSGGAEAILKNMKGNNRRAYNQAEKRDIRVRASSEPADIHHLTELMARVSERNEVQLREAEYITAQAKSLLPQGAGRIYLASTCTSPEGEEIEETVVSAALAYVNDDTVYYAHAGSDYSWRKANPNIVLLTQMMIDAANEGRQYFDFYGIAPENAPDNHPWQGFSRFKKSFGGERRTYLGTWEKPVRRAHYMAYNLGRKILDR